MESGIWHPRAGSVGGGLSKGTMASASTSVWEKAAFPALTLMPNNSFPTYMSVMPFKLLPLRWSSEGVSANKSVCRPFKKNCLGLQKFPSSSASIPAVFHSQKLWGLVFLALKSCAGGPCVRFKLLTPLGVSLKPRYPPQFLSATHGYGTSLFLVSAPRTSLMLLLL